jgi:hypothetical protein
MYCEAFGGQVKVMMIRDGECEHFGDYADMQVAVDSVLSVWREDDKPVVFVLSDNNGSPVLTIQRDCNDQSIAHVLISSGNTHHFACVYFTSSYDEHLRIETFVVAIDPHGNEVGKPRMVA